MYDAFHTQQYTTLHPKPWPLWPAGGSDRPPSPRHSRKQIRPFFWGGGGGGGTSQISLPGSPKAKTEGERYSYLVGEERCRRNCSPDGKKRDVKEWSFGLLSYVSIRALGVEVMLAPTSQVASKVAQRAGSYHASFLGFPISGLEAIAIKLGGA